MGATTPFCVIESSATFRVIFVSSTVKCETIRTILIFQLYLLCFAVNSSNWIRTGLVENLVTYNRCSVLSNITVLRWLDSDVTFSQYVIVCSWINRYERKFGDMTCSESIYNENNYSRLHVATMQRFLCL